MIRRNIFEVSEDEKRRILGLHESATKRQYLFEDIGDLEVLKKLNDFCNSLYENYQNSILDSLMMKVNVTGEPDERTVTVTIGDKILQPVGRLENGRYLVSTPGTTAETFYNSTITIGSMMSEIEKNKDFVTLINKFPQLKEYINNQPIPVRFAVMFSIFVDENPDRKELKYIVNNSPNNDDYQISYGQFYQFLQEKGQYKASTNFYFGNVGGKDLTGNITFYQGGSPLATPMGLTAKLIGGGNTDIVVRPITIKPPAGEPFKFNETNLTDIGQQSIDAFKEEILSYMQKYPKYKDFLVNQKEVPVLAYSSGDGNPDETVPAKNGCPSSSRQEYDLCLSQKRAETIANELNQALGLSIFKGNGKGYENPKVANWTKDKPTKFADTQPNRRFEINLPEYSQLTQ